MQQIGLHSEVKETRRAHYAYGAHRFFRFMVCPTQSSFSGRKWSTLSSDASALLAPSVHLLTRTTEKNKQCGKVGNLLIEMATLKKNKAKYSGNCANHYSF